MINSQVLSSLASSFNIMTLKKESQDSPFHHLRAHPWWRWCWSSPEGWCSHCRPRHTSWKYQPMNVRLRNEMKDNSRSLEDTQVGYTSHQTATAQYTLFSFSCITCVSKKMYNTNFKSLGVIYLLNFFQMQKDTWMTTQAFAFRLDTEQCRAPLGTPWNPRNHSHQNQISWMGWTQITSNRYLKNILILKVRP